MSIVRQWQSGWESGSLEEVSAIVGAADTNFGALTSDSYTGNYSFGRDQATGDGKYIIQDVTATYQIRMGFFIKSTASGWWTDTLRTIIGFYNDSTELAVVRGQSSDWHIETGGTTRDTDTGSYKQNVWEHIGIDIKIDSSGWFNVYKDRVLALNWSGNTGSTQINKVRITDYYNVIGLNGGRVYIDDIYIDNSDGEGSASSLPLLRFYSITPNADGNYSQWLGSDGDSTNNYQLVDEIPESDSDYVVTTGTNNLDSYGMSTFTLGAGEVIDAIIPTVRTKRTSGTEQISMGARVSSTDLLGTTPQDPGASFNYLFERLTGTPSGGDWQQSDLDNVELLIASTGTY
jgi:hypothetical protein